MNNKNEINKIIEATNNILNAKTQIKRRQKSQASQNKQLFISIIQELELTVDRENALLVAFGLEYGNYDDLFYSIIDKLMQLKFGKENSELIFFYLYERKNPDGSINTIKNSRSKEELTLNNIGDLWNFLIKLNP